jgi:pleiotropic regulator 1
MTDKSDSVADLGQHRSDHISLTHLLHDNAAWAEQIYLSKSQQILNDPPPSRPYALRSRLEYPTSCIGFGLPSRPDRRPSSIHIDNVVKTAQCTKTNSNIQPSQSVSQRDESVAPRGKVYQPEDKRTHTRLDVMRPSEKPSQPLQHTPWKLSRVISGHLGWVRSLAVEPGNQWFASGAGDRTIKIWDLASGTLRLTLTGHISAVRGLAISSRHPYLFSCGEDKMVKCWDLETNKVIRHYHGHLSGVYAIALHPTLDVIVTGGRDGVVRVWDMRTRSNIVVLTGHTSTISDLDCQEADPQVISGSLDSTVRLWDLAAGKTFSVLTHHKKGVRALRAHPNEFTFATASTGSIKQWRCPEGSLIQNFSGHDSVINTLSVNASDVLFSGGMQLSVIICFVYHLLTRLHVAGDDGTMRFWDWKTGSCFQREDAIVQPGSLDAERGIMASCFDKTGTRLICGEADKSSKSGRSST